MLVHATLSCITEKKYSPNPKSIRNSSNGRPDELFFPSIYGNSNCCLYFLSLFQSFSLFLSLCVCECTSTLCGFLMLYLLRITDYPIARIPCSVSVCNNCYSPNSLTLPKPSTHSRIRYVSVS